VARLFSKEVNCETDKKQGSKLCETKDTRERTVCELIKGGNCERNRLI